VNRPSISGGAITNPALAEQVKQLSPKSQARLAGLSQALEGATATFGQVQVTGQLFVVGATPLQVRPTSWDTSGYFGWGLLRR